MIWNGWVLGLIVGQAAIAAVSVVAFVNALRIIRHWDTSSLSPLQLDLENRAELIATIVSWSLLFQMFSLVVFEITARSLAPFIPGAMCTTGTLQANRLGWPVLFVKIASLYLYGWWMVVNHVDVRVEGFPLTRFKSRLMVALFPVLLSDIALQIGFFTGLDPSVISSCCGVIFEVGGEGFGSSVASAPPRIMEFALAGFLAGLLVLSFLFKWESKTEGKLVYAAATAVGLPLGMTAVIAFVAPYVYMMPALHCPFIFLDQEHFNFGYLVYVPLFGASFLGMSPALLVMIERRFPSTGPVAQSLGSRFVKCSRVLWILFLGAAYGPLLRFWAETGGSADLFHVGY